MYTANYYTSHILLMDLLQKGIYTSGTLERTQNTFPKTFFKSTLYQIEIIFCYDDHLTVVEWNDRQNVYALSNLLSNELTMVLVRGSDI